MARGAGFPVADIDVGIFADSKVRRLVRQCPDEATAARALVAFLAALLDSWGDGERIPVDDAAPTWLTDVDDLRERLASVGLVDAQGCVPEHAWESWFSPAMQRRIERQEAGRRGGLARAQARPSYSSAVAEPKLSSSKALPDRTEPTEPNRQTDRTVSERLTPQPPTSGGRRANGTNERAVAERDLTEAHRIAEAKRWRRGQRQAAYNRGAITDAERVEMDARDAPLSEIPDYHEHREKIRAEAGL
jgi:hypothetical protein